MEPLVLGVLVLAVAAPAGDPLLALVVPDLLVLLDVRDTLGVGEALPLGKRLGLGQGLLARKHKGGVGKLSDGAVLGRLGREGEEAGEEGLRRGEGEGEEVGLESGPTKCVSGCIGPKDNASDSLVLVGVHGSGVVGGKKTSVKLDGGGALKHLGRAGWVSSSKRFAVYLLGGCVVCQLLRDVHGCLLCRWCNWSLVTAGSVLSTSHQHFAAQK